MNKEILEKMFDERFLNLYEEKTHMDCSRWYFETKNEVKQFILETIIPELLKNINKWNYKEEFNLEFNNLIKLKWIWTDDIYSFMHNFFRLKQLEKAKEQFNIDL
jgi:hypothetical protein